MATEPLQSAPLPAHRRLTLQELVILLNMEDDTEEAPWMVMNDAQFETASDLHSVLRLYGESHDLPWYVASMLPIRYRVAPSRRRRQVSPDLFVAFPRDPRPRRRSSYDVEREGGFPPFVVEVISPESVERDLEEKRLLYWEQGAREYVLFNPMDELNQPRLQGYRRVDGDAFVSWEPDESGRLDSEILGLRLLVEETVKGPTLRAETRAGERLLTLTEMAAAWRQAQAERERVLATQYQTQVELSEEAARRRRLEEEVERLRAQLEREDEG